MLILIYMPDDYEFFVYYSMCIIGHHPKQISPKSDIELNTELNIKSQTCLPNLGGVS